MAIVTRYFSTTAAGATDGTTWADRAALFTAGNWSAVITGFAFNGTDSLRCLIGPGTYTCGQSLASGLFANAPSIANLLFLHGCDSSGVLLTPPDPDWTSNMPAWTDTTLPVINCTTNIQTVNLAACALAFLKFTASARVGTVLNNVWGLNWCVVINSCVSTSAQAITGFRGHHSVLKCTGTSYDGIAVPTTGGEFVNCRFEGLAAASAGNRRGVYSTVNFRLHRCTVLNNAGDGVLSTASSTASEFSLSGCTIVNNGGTGVKANAAASQISAHHVEHCVITGHGAFGIDGQSAARLIAANNRLRDNVSGNIGNLGNYPIDLNTYTTDTDDATEFVDATGGDFRIAAGVATHGQGYGAGDEPAEVAAEPSDAEIAAAVWTRLERTLTA